MMVRCKNVIQFKFILDYRNYACIKNIFTMAKFVILLTWMLHPFKKDKLEEVFYHRHDASYFTGLYFL